MQKQDHREPPDVDPVAQLLRAAGPRAVPDPQRRDLARLAVRDAWQGTLRARSRRRAMIVVAPALAAAAMLVFAVLTRREPPRAADPSIVARVATATGAVRVSSGSRLRIAAAADVVHAQETVETPAGVLATFALEGGGEVRQNGGTSLRWIGGRRIALDRGHVYVDSGPHGEPIQVDTAGGIVRDVGTQFDVRATGGALRVRVREGVVEVETAAGSRRVTAGRGLSITAGSIEDETVPTYGGDWDWILRGTPFRLEGATLGRFVSWVAAEGGRQVEFVPPDLAAELSGAVLHGSIEGLSMDDALEVAFTAAGLVYRLDGSRVVVSRSRTGVVR